MDYSVAAAGICPDQPFLERSPESVARCFDINVTGVFFTAQLAAAQMIRQKPSEVNPKGGSIVLMGSVAAYQASKAQYLSDYCSSKGAILSLAKELGVELADRNVRVNTISPGYVHFSLQIWQKNYANCERYIIRQRATHETYGRQN
jgi:sorbose reductase